jgi:hypothetical protein
VRAFHRTVLRSLSAWLALFALLAVCSCSGKGSHAGKPSNVGQSEELRPEEPLQQLSAAQAGSQTQPPEHFLHKVFSVDEHAQFAFVVPPHQDNARLRGDFRSFTKRSDPDSSSDKTADVGLILLNEQEFNDFLQNRAGSSTYELDPAHNQVVDWRVPTTYADPQTYHLIFSNSQGGTKTKFVKADFTVSFQ